jgi:antitoxin component HigA of HigAB toxin-antitoxin module
MDLLLPQLYKECSKKRDKFDAAIDLVSKLLKNITENPTDDKFRTFRKVIQKSAIFLNFIGKP